MHGTKMKVLVSAVAILVLMIGATQSAFTMSEFQSGYNHGVKDGQDNCLHPDGCHWYILGKDKGFAFHTKEFISGYIAGWCTSSPPGGGSDADQARFECGKSRLLPTR